MSEEQEGEPQKRKPKGLAGQAIGCLVFMVGVLVFTGIRQCITSPRGIATHEALFSRSGWVPFSAPGQDFSVEMPGKPEARTMETSTPAGAAYVKAYQVVSGPYGFMVIVLDLPVGEARVDSGQRALRKTVWDICSRLGASYEILNESECLVGGSPGKELNVSLYSEGESRLATFRHCCRGNRAYVLLLLSHGKAGDRSEIAGKFFGSFRFKTAVPKGASSDSAGPTVPTNSGNARSD